MRSCWSDMDNFGTMTMTKKSLEMRNLQLERRFATLCLFKFADQHFMDMWASLNWGCAKRTVKRSFGEAVVQACATGRQQFSTNLKAGVSGFSYFEGKLQRARAASLPTWEKTDPEKWFENGFWPPREERKTMAQKKENDGPKEGKRWPENSPKSHF